MIFEITGRIRNVFYLFCLYNILYSVIEHLCLAKFGFGLF